jgi:hypothetical protein|tara:strand:- start:17739 stop:17972 length:234 start_codon:yes stop_codon:yes gene_type:complete
MLDSNKVIELWQFFKEYLDQKQIEVIAEKYVDLLADYGVPDEELQDAIGHDDILDDAINYYLDVDNEDKHDDELEDY